MKKKIIASVLVSAILASCAVAFTACERVTTTSKTSSTSVENVLAQTDEERAATIVEAMSTREKIGQVLSMDFRRYDTEQDFLKKLKENDASLEDLYNDESFMHEELQKNEFYSRVHSLNDEIKSIMKDYHLGNILLFGENCSDVESLTRLTYDLQKTAIESKNLPLIILTDMEGGNVARLYQGTTFAGAMSLASNDNIDDVKEAATIIAKELKAVGINMNLAPVVDINSNPDNPVIGIRSFGETAEKVSKFAVAYMDALKENGIMSTAKHFPGHGDTSTDSHTSLPVVDISKDEWLNREAVPFIASINNGVNAIMSAHVQMPQLDSTQITSSITGETIYLPATLSKTIISDILRNELGFDGLILSDNLTLQGIEGYFTPEEAVIMALNAGIDILGAPVSVRNIYEVEKLENIYKAIENALEDGTLSQERLDESATRVVLTKIKNGILDADYDYDIEEAVQNALKTVGNEEHRKVERRLTFNAIKTYQNGELVSYDKFIPFDVKEGEKIVFITPMATENFSIEHVLLRLEKEGKKLDASIFDYEEGNLTEKAIDALENADYIVVFTRNLASTINDPDSWRNTAFKKVLSHAKTMNVAIVCTDLPYKAEEYAKTYSKVLVTYDYRAMHEEDIGATHYSDLYSEAIPSAVDKILGNTAALN